MSDEKHKPFPFDQFEPEWQQLWATEKTYRTPNPGDADFDASKPKYFVLDMFPYPSGAGLHVGHPEGYTATDILGRYKRMNGFNVLHPMGWDAFGLPAEQYAIKTGQHPRITTEANTENFRAQLQRLGFAYDWDREINTTDPDYVRWTQWIFLQLYNSYYDPELKKAQPISLLEEAMSDNPKKVWTAEENAFLAGCQMEWKDMSPEKKVQRQKMIDGHRLAFIHEAPVNWSPDLGTVLANEEVEEWKAKGHTVERRPLRQWMLRITKYAQRLIDDLEPLDWPDSIKALQRNWIGKSEGAAVSFEIQSSTINDQRSVEVFTTRPDTLFGATYMVLAPEHSLVSEITTPEQKDQVDAYIKTCASKSDMERGEMNKDKTGVVTGAFAINPVNGEKIPIWLADYVMMGYGTGAIMAVPAHDERDIAFAHKFEIEIKQVVAKQPLSDELIESFLSNRENDPDEDDAPIMLLAHGGKADMHEVNPSFNGQPGAFTETGYAVNSDFLNGLPTAEAKAKMIDWLEENGKGSRQINFKLRDWLFSRQRYWGEPFPLLWDKETGQHSALPESELPLLQPEMEDFKPTGDPRGPLLNAKDWINYSDQYTRETNTMPQWAGSCWYYMRYCDPRNTDRFISKEAEQYWGGTTASGMARPGHDQKNGEAANSSENSALRENKNTAETDRATTANAFVDLYVGGTEHAVLHLLYARFWHKVLHDLGHLDTVEPFKKLVNQGLILGEDGQKMSKSLGNVVNPDDVVRDYGADSLRLYEMFMGPLEQVKPWQMKGVEGVSRFLAKVWRIASSDSETFTPTGKIVEEAAPSKALLKVLHETIKKVGEDIERLSFNTAISQMMICTKAFQDAESFPPETFVTFLKLLNPFAPHLTEELNKQVAGASRSCSSTLLSEQTWPTYDEALMVESEVTIIVQVNGKLRAKLTVSKDIDKAELEALAQDQDSVKAHTDGKTIRKVIVIPGKLVNIVAN